MSIDFSSVVEKQGEFVKVKKKGESAFSALNFTSKALLPIPEATGADVVVSVAKFRSIRIFINREA